MFWKGIKDERPFVYERGKWDGLRSNQLIVEDKKGEFHLVHLYEGRLDGSEFSEFVEPETGYVIDDVITWSYLTSSDQTQTNSNKLTIFNKMVDEMPFVLHNKEQIKPYILEAMELYAQSFRKEKGNV